MPTHSKFEIEWPKIVRELVRCANSIRISVLDHLFLVNTHVIVFWLLNVKFREPNFFKILCDVDLAQIYLIFTVKYLLF